MCHYRMTKWNVWTAHNILPFDICMDSCYTEFMDFMQYTSGPGITMPP